MRKNYEKPSIELLDYAQRDSIAACGAWLTGVIGSTCNSSSYEDDGMVECNPDMPYDK